MNPLATIPAPVVDRIAFLASLATAAPLLGCGPFDGLAGGVSVLVGTPSPDDRPPSGWFFRVMGVLVVALAAAILRTLPR